MPTFLIFHSLSLKMLVDRLFGPRIVAVKGLTAIWVAVLTTPTAPRAMTAAVHDTENCPSVICISWGGPEATATNQFQEDFDHVLQEAAHLGITVCVASGNNGSGDYPPDEA